MRFVCVCSDAECVISFRRLLCVVVVVGGIRPNLRICVLSAACTLPGLADRGWSMMRDEATGACVLIIQWAGAHSPGNVHTHSGTRCGRRDARRERTSTKRTPVSDEIVDSYERGSCTYTRTNCIRLFGERDTLTAAVSQEVHVLTHARKIFAREQIHTHKSANVRRIRRYERR